MAVVGLIVSILAFVVSFFPPSSLPGGSSDTTYVSLLVVSFIIIFALPLLFMRALIEGNKANVSMIHIKSHNAPKGHFLSILVLVQRII